MRICDPELSPAELIHLLRAETKAAHGVPSLHIRAEKEYIFDNYFDGAAYGLGDRAAFALVTSAAKLTVEPWVEKGYWILQITVERALGPVQRSKQYDLTRRYLTLDGFDKELSARGEKRVDIQLYVDKPDVKQDFNRWLAEMRRRHPWTAKPESEVERAGATIVSSPNQRGRRYPRDDHGNNPLRRRSTSQ